MGKGITTIRKTVTILSLFILMLSMSIAVYAEEIEGEESGDQTITVNLEAPEWVMIIPADVNITQWSDSVNIGQVTIKLKDVASFRESDVITAYMNDIPEPNPEKPEEKYLYLVKTDDETKKIPFTLHIHEPNLKSDKTIDWVEYDVPEQDNGKIRIAAFYGQIKDQGCSSREMTMHIDQKSWNTAAYGEYKIKLSYSSSLR